MEWINTAIELVKEHWVIAVIVVVIIVATVVFFILYPYALSGMRTSSSEIAKLQNEEGLRLQVYADSGGVLTVGYGHTGPDVDALGLGTTITSGQATNFLISDVQKFEAQLNSILPSQVSKDLDQNQWDALIDFLFNTDATTSSLFTEYVDNEDWQGAATFLDSHYITDAAGNRLPGLVTRRADEAGEITS